MTDPSALKPLGNAPEAAADAPVEETPAERRKRRVRDAIIVAAEEVFAEEGEAGLSMRRLAEKIDYSPAAIYKYFRSKDDLVHAIRELFFERLLARLEVVLADFDWSSEHFARGLKAYIEVGVEEPRHYCMGFAHAEDDTIDEAVDTKAFEAASFLENMISEGQERGLFIQGDPALLSKCVWASLHGVTMLLAEMQTFPANMPGSEHLTRDALIDAHVELLARGLLAH